LSVGNMFGMRGHIGELRCARIGVGAPKAASGNSEVHTGEPKTGRWGVRAMRCISRSNHPKFTERPSHAQGGIIGTAINVGRKKLKPLPNRSVVVDTIVASEAPEVVEDAGDHGSEGAVGRNDVFPADAAGHDRSALLSERETAIPLGNADIVGPVSRAAETAIPARSSGGSPSADMAHPQKPAAITRQTSQAPVTSRIPIQNDAG
jgi:hypothetical protein